MRDTNIWIFNSGMSFSGNPKWLFLYIIKHRPEITPYWFCYNKESMQYIRKLGYQAYLFRSSKAKEIGEKAGVYVVNQRKEVFQNYLKGITILNLWHGVGCKTIEKNVRSGILEEGIVKKNIVNLNTYRNNELFLVTSPLMEKHFIEQCNIKEEKIIRGGYPCCFYNEKITTFDHDILKEKYISRDTKIAIYTPTYRENSLTNFFTIAIPDMESLAENLKKNNMVLIFKLHPNMEKDFQYLNIKKMYANSPQFIFWDNSNDIYEIFDKIDLAIIDYSSIFYDMLAHGIKYFIRYIFDYDNKENIRDFALDYIEMTCGLVCKDFNSLLRALSDYQNKNLENEIIKIKKLFWEYADIYSLDSIVDRAKSFLIDNEEELPTLYSFDIFDTLIGRSTLLPIGVFWYVQNKINESSIEFPRYLKENYFKIRPWCERDVREYYNKSTLYRNNDRLEITFDLIFEHMQNVYQLNEKQITLLKEWELEGEFKSSIPIEKNISILRELVEQKETVVLISDMYLPIKFIKKLLAKADPILEQLPLFLSSESGNQKTTKKLFIEVYHQINYNFGKWIHYGDNQKADIDMPKKLGIKTIKIKEKTFNTFEKRILDFIHSYDAYQVCKMMLDIRTELNGHAGVEHFAFRQVSFYFVPYINWAIHHAIEQGFTCLYFISRDGYHLKRIADTIIEEKNYRIKTKYIYGSRKAWRIPSLIDSIDEEFWSNFGNFVDINDYKHLLEASALTDELFMELFPELSYLREEKKISPKMIPMIREVFRASERYCSYLLDIAKEQRKNVQKYLLQEIDFSEKYAFVEFWGRGYTQTCLAKLLWDIQGKVEDNVFYYARSIYPTHENLIRYNFTGNTFSLVFIENIFANLPYRSVKDYMETDKGIEPVLVPNENNVELHEALENYLPYFAKNYVNLEFQNEEAINRALFDFGLSYFHRHPNDPIWIRYFAGLKDSISSYKEPIAWAPPMEWKDVFGILCGKKFITKNKNWSIKQSSKSIKKAYSFYSKRLKGKKIVKRLRKVLLVIFGKH